MSDLWKRIVVFAGMIVLASLPAAAGSGYVGASVGQSDYGIHEDDFDDGSLSVKLDTSDTGFKIFGGYTFLKFFALETAWQDLGTTTVKGTSDGTGPDYILGDFKAKVSVDGFSLSAIGRLPIGERFAIFGKLGYFFWDGEAKISNESQHLKFTDDGNDVIYGAGLEFSGGRGGTVRLEWEQYQDVFDDVRIDMYSIGYQWNFGS